jgi:cytochrome oxidase Cu insertion factor (SCO1/SenC/PrrC family)
MRLRSRAAPLAMLAALTAGCMPTGSIRVGQPAQLIRGTDADGKSFSLDDYRGKVVLLDFWGNW